MESSSPAISRRRLLSLTGAALLGVAAGAAKGESPASPPRAPMRGVNLESGAWGWWPPLDFYNYYLDKGFTVFRLCFNWNQLQPDIGRPLAAPLLSRMDDVIHKLAVSGASVILDQHDYMRRDKRIIGASEFTTEQYAGLWRALADRYKDNRHILFGLMNEPHDLDDAVLVKNLNAAIAAIRDTGASNTILCPGNDWSNGQRWIKSGNDRLADLIAPDPALWFEVHQYLDAWGQGQNPVAEPGSGTRLDEVTSWARRTGRKLFLGEFSAGADAATLIELHRMLSVVKDSPDVWMGYCYWSSGGGKTADRWYSLDPVDGRDRPQLKLLLSI